MEIKSPANLTYIQKQINDKQNSPLVMTNAPLDNDEFIKNKKSNKAKNIIIAGIGIITLGTTAFIFRKDISKTFSKLKNSISFKGKTEPKKVEKYLDLSKPEKIKIPTGNYDLTKEASSIEFTTNNSYTGFSWMSKHADGKTTFSTPICDTIPHVDSNNIGISKNGIAYVYVNTKNLGLDDYMLSLREISEQNKKALSSIVLFSKDSNFTPAQKNIIAIMHQKLGNSPNSIFKEGNRILYDYIGDGRYDNNVTFEQLMQKIGKWAQDIDTSNRETEKLLGGLSSLKQGEQFAIPDKIAEASIRIHNTI